MKPSLKLFLTLITLSCLLSQCKEDDVPQNTKVQFGFQLQLPDAGGRTSQVADLPEGASLRVSISTSSGTPVFTLQEVELLKVGDSYISEPLTLPPGNYTLEHFLVVNESHEVLYAIPHEDSPLAELVDDPLPIPFEATENNMSNISVSVVSTEAHVPEDFGFVSFGIEFIDPIEFTLSVFIPSDGALELTSAKAFLLHGTDTVVRELLDPTINHINFFGNDASTYSLVIVKDAYGKYTREFVLADLKNELNGQPLSVVLDPALTFMAFPQVDFSDYLFQFNVALGSADAPGSLEEGSVTIDWGDGVQQSYDLTQLCPSCPIEHRYTTSQQRFISVTGDIDAIFSVLFNYPYSTTGKITLNQLSNLYDLRMSTTYYYPEATKSIDISDNKKLTYLILSRSKLTALDVSDHPVLRLMYLDETNFNTAAIDKIIDDFYNNVINNDLPNPIFGYEKYPGTGVRVGPPSQSSIDKLYDLWQNHGGEISPL